MSTKYFFLVVCFITIVSCHKTPATPPGEVSVLPPVATAPNPRAESPAPLPAPSEVKGMGEGQLEGVSPSPLNSPPLPPNNRRIGEGGGDQGKTADVIRTINEVAQEVTENNKMCVVIIKTYFAGSGESVEGTGFIIEKTPVVEGVFTYNIMTNEHVLNERFEEEKGWKIFTADNSSPLNDPKLFGIDYLTDVAVVQVKSDLDLPVCVFGDSTQVKTLDEIISIGNTLGYGVITATGLVSQPLTGHPESEFGVMQTDAATNSGNSGCPIFNRSGEVIGMHALGDRKTGSLVGFEIPSERLVKTYDMMKKSPFSDQITYSRWGLTVYGLNSEMRDTVSGGELKSGVAVAKVFKNSAAEKAGIEAGDIITAINGNTVLLKIEDDRNLYTVLTFMRDSAPGESYKLDTWRGGKKIEIIIVPEEETFKRAEAFHTLYGFTVAEISPEDRSLFDIGVNGVWVSFDNEKNDRLHINLMDRTIVTHINGKPTPTVAEFKRLLSEAQGSGKPSAMLTVVRSSKNFTSYFGVDGQLYTLIRL